VVEEVEVGQRTERVAVVEVESVVDRVLSVGPRAREPHQQVTDGAAQQV
jgi:hypothetical protein